MNATIWHNSRCSNSRGALALLQEAGIEVEIINYLDTPPSAAELGGLLKQMNMPARDLLSSKEAAYGELDLAAKLDDDDALIAAMVAHPALINRPIVRTSKGTALCRPPETVLALIG